MFVPPNFRLGYACICTELRKKGIFSSRTLRLATLESKGISYAQELATQNLKDLKSMLEWNKQHNISFMRLSSEIFPFATHEKFGYSLDFADNLLKDIGNYAKENNMRLTMHPAQFNVLSSPSEKVIKNTIKDLDHHCEILDKMGLDHNSVLIIHGGGVYGNKKESLNRLKQNFKLLSENTQKRLVLENCEISYTVEELLPISEELQIPLVLDFHHDDLKNSSQPISFFFERVFKVWNDRGIKPKIHVSNSIPNLPTNASMTQKRKHSDYIYFFHEELLKIKFPIDVMLECKMKEQSILQFQQIETQKTSQSQIIEIKSNEIKQEIETQKTSQPQIVEIELNEKEVVMIQKHVRGYLVRKNMLIPDSCYQTKVWRQCKDWYKNGKSNECEKYQINTIEKIINNKLKNKKDISKKDISKKDNIQQLFNKSIYKNWIKLLPINKTIKLEDYNRKEYFTHVADIKLDNDIFTSGKNIGNKKRNTVIKFEPQIPNNELNEKTSEWLYLLVVNGYIVKIGGTRTGLKNRITSYLCGHHIKERGKSGDCSKTNAFIYNTFEFYLNLGCDIKMYGYKLPKTEFNVEIFTNKVKVIAQTYHAYESTFLEDYNKNYNHYPILSENCDPSYKF
jgi:UV damage endonuclease UvdE